MAQASSFALWSRGNVAKNNKTSFFYVLYSDKTWVFDQSECAQGPIYIINDYNVILLYKKRNNNKRFRWALRNERIGDMKGERRFDDSMSSLSSFKYMMEFYLLELINNSSSVNKGNHDRDGVWISDLN